MWQYTVFVLAWGSSDSCLYADISAEVIGIVLGPVHMIPIQRIAPGQLTDPRGQLFLGARSDACNCSHEFLVAP